MAPREAIALNRLPPSNPAQTSSEQATAGGTRSGPDDRSSTLTNQRTETRVPILATGENEGKSGDCLTSGVRLSDRVVGLAVLIFFVTTLVIFVASSKSLWDLDKWKGLLSENVTEAEYDQ